MKLSSKNLAIIIPTLYKNKIFLKKTIKSIFNQSISPAQILIISDNKRIVNENFIKKKNIFILTSKIKNQVLQRNIGFKNLSSQIKIVVQLDDYFILDKNCLSNLLNLWNKVKDPKVAGIGLNELNNKKKNFIKVILGLDSYFPGKILKNGFNSDYANVSEDQYLDWLKGGCSSYNLKKIKNFLETNNKYNIVKWSVGEDIDFSIKLKKNYKLMVCSKAKIYMQNSKRQKLSVQENFERGKLHTLYQCRLVQSNEYFSYKYFLYSVIINSLLSIFYNLIFINKKSLMYGIGRLVGIFK